ncbi:thiamine biosynthesis protein ThiC [Bacillus sp. NRRL B-14911]|nr:thiamine biosynthesis protein ThiC [Bacillus sp. NRRL B-14911]
MRQLYAIFWPGMPPVQYARGVFAVKK